MLKSLLYIITIYFPVLFFSVNSILGRTYEGSDTSNVYIASVIIFDALAIIIAIIGIFKCKHINIRTLFVLCFPFFVLLIYGLEGATAMALIRGFIAFSIPCIYIALDVALNKSINQLTKWLDVVMLVVSIALIIALPSVIKYRIISIGGESYQSFSYYAGLSFSINLFMLFFGGEFDRFKFVKTSAYRVLAICLLAVQIGASLMSGGRGGFVLIIASAGICFIVSLSHNKNRKKTGIILSILAVSFVSITVIRLLPQEILSAINVGGERVFAYITDSGIDMTETSGRDNVYATAIQHILDKPVYGYGIFTYYDQLGNYPHNIFLEVLLQGGILLFIVFIIFILFIFNNARKLVRDNWNYIIVLLFLLYPSIILMFSLSYMQLGVFWFIITFLFISKIDTSTSKKNMIGK